MRGTDIGALSQGGGQQNVTRFPWGKSLILGFVPIT